MEVEVEILKTTGGRAGDEAISRVIFKYNLCKTPDILLFVKLLTDFATQVIGE